MPDYWWDGTQALEQEGPKVDLSPYYTKDEINNIVDDINQKIEDKSTSIIFDTYIQMKSFVDDPTNADKLKEGTILLIREKNVPDYYYDGAGVEDIEGVIINGKNGGNATYYGGGGGGASKASNSGATRGRGGSGYRGIIILHYFKNG